MSDEEADLEATELRMNHNIELWDGAGRECGMVRMLSREVLALVAEVRRLRARAVSVPTPGDTT